MSRDDVGYDPWREYVAPVIDPHAGNRDRDGNVLVNDQNTRPIPMSDHDILMAAKASSYQVMKNSGDLGLWYAQWAPGEMPARAHDWDYGDRSR